MRPRGMDEAERMLPEVEKGEEIRERCQREQLHEASQLPDVEGTRLRFVIDVTGTIRDGYNELKALLKERYGSRFAALTPTTGAKYNLLGDKVFVSLDPS